MIDKEKLITRLKESDIDKLSNIYVLLNDICSDYSRMTDGYSIATGDNKFENVPDNVVKMIEERQMFFNYRNNVKNIIKDEIQKIMNDDI